VVVGLTLSYSSAMSELRSPLPSVTPGNGLTGELRHGEDADRKTDGPRYQLAQTPLPPLEAEFRFSNFEFRFSVPAISNRQSSIDNNWSLGQIQP